MKDCLEDSKKTLTLVATRLTTNEWFGNDWRHSVHYFPAPPAVPESVTLHVYKQNWFNENRQGIHFETQLGPRQFAQKTVSIMLHVLHTDTIPGTTLKRIKLTKPLVDEFYASVAKWDGYSFRAGKYGAQSFSAKLAFTPDTIVDQLYEEYVRLCIEIGPRIDKALATVLPQP